MWGIRRTRARAKLQTQSLEELDLRYTSLNHRTMPQFARTLRTQHTLTVLHLENCSIGSQSMLILGMLSQKYTPPSPVCAFKVNTTLKELYLGENNLSPSDGAHLYQLIMGSVSLQLLDLRHNSLQDVGLGHICDALKEPDSWRRGQLNTLVLWNNRFTPGAMHHLDRALVVNERLETLNIGCNHVSSAGVESMKMALLRNHTLKRLGLQACKLNCQGVLLI